MRRPRVGVDWAEEGDYGFTAKVDPRAESVRVETSLRWADPLMREHEQMDHIATRVSEAWVKAAAMRSVQLTPQENLLWRKLTGAQGRNFTPFMHGNNQLLVDDEGNVPATVRAVKAMVALGWDKAIVRGLVAKLKDV